MKLVCFVLWAALSVNVLAAVPYYDQRDMELPHGAYWDGNTLVMPNVDDTNPEDEDEEAKDYPEHGFEVRATVNDTSELSNATTASTSSTGNHDKDDYVVDLRVSETHTHIGSLSKQRFWQKMYDCLQFVGVQGHGKKQGGDKIDLDQPERCSSTKKDVCAPWCTIDNIVYQDKNSHGYGSGGWLTVTAWWSELYESHHAGIRDQAFKFVADVYKLVTERGENCYDVDLEGTRRMRFCNVPTNVLVVWPARNDKSVEARLNVNVAFNGETTSKQYYCLGMRPYINEHYQKKIQPELEKVMSYDSSNVYFYNTCQEEACFDVRDGYWDGKPWKEPKGCDEPK
ncbi:hypothetical protein HBI56_083730 [Parastagonospora nodorum]|uniref:Uncharacterized protein n=2 Tax=Phaeosphaeria nodorum (strain SN15 / ATCC MYA-4574 / FGSC 10173) TaxID=321614 RepID=A0A7U2I8H1_PHANO|nr:hypothetical protein HBH56_102840 [Parastagonospora nodorum]QRD04563.1 hypothetical protein JI435_105040 [Parastagonospora nodorum SN15]KAH3929419.1 hypothetical protein HBH54_127570 [Parastagonospora nodorum]KAH3978823.1 hypothetical protein HBH51_062210 [Parastagonospora nodorum]KAH3998941.1 hypothetical protein HBI10_118850 [Parastagonospora nodorum]